MSGIGIPPSCSLESFRNENGPLIDIRSPGEFQQGHWPGATNIPLFNDKERELVGTSYKREGRNKAIILGLQITKKKLPELKNALESKASKSKNSFLRIYCWRGGLRSSSIGWLATFLKIKTILLKGGYKTYRKWSLSQFNQEWPLRIIGGKTGSGKTALLLSLKEQGVSVIDLEGIANHRGSSFGGIGFPEQPTSEHFENTIAEELNVCKSNAAKGIWLEDESINLGKCRIPKDLFNQMRIAPMLEIIRNKKERVLALVKEYGQYEGKHLEEATSRISKRLGPQRTASALQAIQRKDFEGACIVMLEYYDKCYEFSLEKVENKSQIDISGMNNQSAAKKLIKIGQVY